jgi:PAS domain S-box-containing protein
MTIVVTEETLANDAELLRAVLNTVIDGLVTIDNRGVIHSFNPAASRIFGYRPDEVIGQDVRMLMPEPYHGEHDGYLRSYVETGTAKVIGIGREVTARRKDGSVFPMELGVNEMRYGERRMFVGAIRDITDRKHKQDLLDRIAWCQNGRDALDYLSVLRRRSRRPPWRQSPADPARPEYTGPRLASDARDHQGR